MNKFLPFLMVMLTLGTVSAQTLTPNDSVSLGAQYANMVFYNLSTGNQTVASNTDWHLAISVRPTPIPPGGNPQEGAVIRMNEPLGMAISVAPRNDAATFSTIDTTDFASWTRLHDADTNMIEGVLNANRNMSNPFDFGWGFYNQTSHNLVGDSVFIIQLPGGVIKKLIVEGLFKDTAYDIKYANLDNSDLQQIHITKANYAGKNFVYLNLLDNTIHDKEPLASVWDLQFLKYTGIDVLTLPVYAVTGVWSNRMTTVAEVMHRDVMNNDFSGETFYTDMDVIGWDWKTFSGSYVMTDSLVYFVKTQSQETFKMVFTGFSGSATGTFYFYKQEVSGSTGIEEADLNQLTVYPNPASNQFSVQSESAINEVRVYDLAGNVLMNHRPMGATAMTVNTSSLANGIYLVAIASEKSVVTKRVFVNH